LGIRKGKHKKSVLTYLFILTLQEERKKSVYILIKNVNLLKLLL